MIATTMTVPGIKNSSVPQGGGDKSDEFRPEQLRELSSDLSKRVASAVKRFSEIHMQTQILSVNAGIEASRAGEAGRSFSVVADQMKDLSKGTSEIADSLANEVKYAIDKIDDFSRILGSQVRGTRLLDLALTNIDLIDRNLYERSCDVRWWATDSSVVDACDDKSPERCRYASERLGVILDAYTVYYDLVLCDLHGEVIANGRPGQYSSQGMNCSKQTWFQQAMNSRSGDEFGFEAVHESPLVNGKRILAYSCGVRRDGQANGPLVGVLGILFNWDALAGNIVKQTPISDEEWSRTRVCIVDENGHFLADTKDAGISQKLDLSKFTQMKTQKKSFEVCDYLGKETVVACAKAPGYETYTTGWYSLILQATS